jgi:type III restriction enzyme
LIDSDALENSDQIDDGFKRIFAVEIEQFKHEYRLRYPDRSAENLTDADILREVVNTIGKRGTLGSHIRCVVSVSMLTEGWDANTVTHIMGLRAFGSQLLCEQVAGRALRRRDYFVDPKTGKFPPEYAHIIGVPFKMFKGGTVEPPKPVELKKIRALPERETDFEITFPNLVGYRVEVEEGEIKADFSKIHNFDIDFTRLPLQSVLGNAFSPEKEKNGSPQRAGEARPRDTLSDHPATHRTGASTSVPPKR